MIALNVLSRSYDSCGDCDACCTVMGVRELGKPHYVRCEHANGAGCDIHANKPQSCAGWSCLWRRGMLGDRPELRPDRYGYMLTHDERNHSIVAYQVRPNNLPPPDKVAWLAERTLKRYGKGLGMGFVVNEFGGYAAPEQYPVEMRWDHYGVRPSGGIKFEYRDGIRWRVMSSAI